MAGFCGGRVVVVDSPVSGFVTVTVMVVTPLIRIRVVLLVDDEESPLAALEFTPNRIPGDPAFPRFLPAVGGDRHVVVFCPVCSVERIAGGDVRPLEPPHGPDVATAPFRDAVTPAD